MTMQSIEPTMQHHPHITRIAVDAILAQISAKSDCEGRFYGDVDGTECEFTAMFSTDWTGPYSEFGRRGSYYEATCKLLGAFADHPETEAMIAGNRAEIAALVGEKAVEGWEDDQASRVMEAAE